LGSSANRFEIHRLRRLTHHTEFSVLTIVSSNTRISVWFDSAGFDYAVAIVGSRLLFPRYWQSTLAISL